MILQQKIAEQVAPPLLSVSISPPPIPVLLYLHAQC